MNSESARHSFLRAVRILQRRWPFALIALSLTLAAGLCFLRAQQPWMRATSLLVLRNPPSLGMSDVLGLTGIKLPGAIGVGAPAGGISLEAAARQVQSRFNWPEAEKRLARWKGRNGRSPAAPISEDTYFSSLLVDTVAPDQLLVRGTAHDPLVAQAVSEVAAQVAVDASVRDARADWKRIVEYAGNELPRIEREMNRSNRTLADFQRRHRLYDAANSARNLGKALIDNLDKLAESQAKLQGSRRRLERAQSEFAREARVEVGELPQEDPVVVALRNELSRANTELIRARADFADDAPEVVAAQEHVNQIERRLREQVGKTIQVPHGEFNARRTRLFDEMVKSRGDAFVGEAAVSAHTATMKKIEGNLAEITSQLADYQGLAQASKVKEGSYLAFLAKLQEAMVYAAVQPGNLRLTDLAGGAAPFGLPASRKAALLVLAAVAVAWLAAYLAELLLDVVYESDHVASLLDASVVGVLPLARDREPALAIVRHPESALAEAMRKAWANLRHTAADSAPKVLLVTSAQRREGKTTVACNLALTAARAGLRTTLVDCNLRAPALAGLFSAPAQGGLGALLTDSSSLENELQTGPLDALRLLLTYGRMPNAPDLLESTRMQRVIEQLRERNDLVVLDAPALLDTADARLLAARADATLLVVRSGRTSRSALYTCRRILSSAGAHLHGLMLNGSSAGEVVTPAPARPAPESPYGEVS